MTTAPSGGPDPHGMDAQVAIPAAEVAARCGLAHRPTAEQAAVIEAPLRSALVVAGAGSGKTETMAARVVWLVANRLVEPDQVLGLTFTRKAAKELSERVAGRLRSLQVAGLWQPSPDEDGTTPLEVIPTISTYHSYAGRLVRENALRLGYEPESRLLSEAAAWQYAAEVTSRYDGPMDDVDYGEASVINAVVDLAGEMSEHLLEPSDVREHLDQVIDALESVAPVGKRTTLPIALDLARLRARRAILPIVDAYQQLKRDRDAMDFADQIRLAAQLARGVPEVADAERARYQVVLLDEFQDTSEAQLILLRELFATGAQARPVMAVGDPNQSIYGWRGASATTLARFPREFPAPDGRPSPVLPLATSWRNTESVLVAANTIAAPLRASSSVAVAELAARPGAGAGSVQVARLVTQRDEAETIADWLAARRVGSSAVLCRKRSQFAPVMQALDDRGIPYEVVGLGGLLLTPEVGDIVSALTVVNDPARGDALMRLLTGPPIALGPADLDGLMAWARHRQRRPGASGDRSDRGPRELSPDAVDTPSLAEALDQLPGPDWTGPSGARISRTGLDRLAGLGRTMAHLRRLSALPLADLVGEAERALGLDIEVLARPGYTPAAARAHLDAFADVAAGFTNSADRPTLAGFLAWLDAALEEERGLEKGYIEASTDAVQIMTVHAAKGLEWDHVVVPGLVESIFPARLSVPNPNWTATSTGGRWTVPEPTDKGWLRGLSGVPYDLRGDRDGLPHLDWAALVDFDDVDRDVDEFVDACGRHDLAEERRLAYVAITRAKHDVLLSAPIWTTGSRLRVTGRFLTELVPWLDPPNLDPSDGGASGGDPGDRRPAGDRTVVVHWEPMPLPSPDLTNPLSDEDLVLQWPLDPDLDRRRALLWAQAAVTGAEATTTPSSAADPLAADPLAGEVDLLLAERADRQRARERPAAVDLPRQLSASAIVALARDPGEFALGLRRPMPQPPAYAARRGTQFHAWVEQHYAQAALLDVTELPGSADDDADPGADLPTMKANFLASPWAARTPLAIELPVETVIDGVAIRGRIDAVFERPDGGRTIVDWKTGTPPRSEELDARSLQLAAYAVGYARLNGLDPALVDAAFYYVAADVTVRPEIPSAQRIADLLRSVSADGSADGSSDGAAQVAPDGSARSAGTVHS